MHAWHAGLFPPCHKRWKMRTYGEQTQPCLAILRILPVRCIRQRHKISATTRSCGKKMKPVMWSSSWHQHNQISKLAEWYTPCTQALSKSKSPIGSYQWAARSPLRSCGLALFFDGILDRMVFSHAKLCNFTNCDAKESRILPTHAQIHLDSHLFHVWQWKKKTEAGLAASRLAIPIFKDLEDWLNRGGLRLVFDRLCVFFAHTLS